MPRLGYRPVPVVVGGTRFETILEAAKLYDVLPQTAARRLRSGWPPNEAFGLKRHRRKHRPGRMLTTSRGVFRTVEEGAAFVRMDPKTVAARLRLGWTDDEALGFAGPPPRRPRPGVVIKCEGKSYPSIAALARAYNRGEVLVYKRLRAKWSAEAAVGLEPPPPRFRNQKGGARTRHWKHPEIVDGREQPGAELGQYKLYVIRNRKNGREYVGITVSPLDLRLRNHRADAKRGKVGHLYHAMRHYGAKHFEIELIRSDARSQAELQQQEIEEIQRRGTLKNGYNASPGGSIGTSKAVTVAGQEYESYAVAAAAHEVAPGKFALRVGRLHWTPEQAAGLEPRGKYARRIVTAGGQTYPSLRAAALSRELDYRRVHTRVHRLGWTYDQALEFVPPPESVRFQGIAVTVGRRRYRSIAACARANDLHPESLRRRMVQRDETAAEAVRALRARRKGKR